jgi:cytochrome P450
MHDIPRILLSDLKVSIPRFNRVSIMVSNIELAASLSILGIALLVNYIWARFFSLQGLPSNLPWAGARNSPISRANTIRRSLFGLREIIEDGYYQVCAVPLGGSLFQYSNPNKFSKKEQAFVLPNLATGPEVILPMSQMKWLLEQPDHVLNQREVNSEFLHAERTMLHPHVIRDTVHGHIIRQELTKNLDSYAEDIVDEIKHALDHVWGSSEIDWNEVPLYNTMLEVVGRISNRVLVGLPLCRDKAYLQSTCSFARNVVITAGLINLLPPLLRPLLGPLITAYDKRHYRRIAKMIFPIVKQRMVGFKPGTDYRNPDYSKNNDYIQWALHDAFSHDDPAERTPEMITKRLTVLSFAAIQSSVITITNAIFDIASSPRSGDIQQSLQDEVVSITSERQGQEWKRASLASMIRVDSALRESMRLWGFISRGVMKKVVAPEGVFLPSGEHLPYGAKVGVTSYGIHHDESVYSNAGQYEAFRFSTATEAKQQDGAGAIIKPANLITTDERLMAFSHGRHAW